MVCTALRPGNATDRVETLSAGHVSALLSHKEKHSASALDHRLCQGSSHFRQSETVSVGIRFGIVLQAPQEALPGSQAWKIRTAPVRATLCVWLVLRVSFFGGWCEGNPRKRKALRRTQYLENNLGNESARIKIVSLGLVLLHQPVKAPQEALPGSQAWKTRTARVLYLESNRGSRAPAP